MFVKGLDHLSCFTFAQQAMIDKDTGEPVANRFMDQRGRNRTVNAAAQPADHMAIRSDLCPNAFDHFVDKVARGPVAAAAADAFGKVFEQDNPLGRVDYFGVKLDRVDLFGLVHNGGVGRIVTGGNRGKTGGNLLHAITVAHPDLEQIGHAGKK